MSVFVQRLRERFSPEEKLKKQAKKALDIADRIIIQMQTQKLGIKKCVDYQKTLLGNLEKVMDGAKKVGNKPLWMQTAKLFEVVADWHKVTQNMMEDEALMIQFIAMTKTFFTAVIEYKEVVKQFSKTTKEFVSLKKFGLSIPMQIKVASSEAAASFRELANSLASLNIGYTRLTDYVLMDDADEERLSKRFDEERRKLLEQQKKNS